ncbi:MAG: HlyD family type I secretion periplasmic adaptor subunit [Pseudomonadales bacterium]|nr:HlyD family type I secretion periplasmic adaptor subunit [Pseudomonadales bacterium]
MPSVRNLTFDQARLAFLPAALEVQQRPPHPFARWLGYGIALFFTVILLWACFGKVDVVAVAEGKIIPSARVKQVQPLEKGVVHTIHVVEGQRVRAGDVLVTLDHTSTRAGKDKQAHDLAQAERNLARERQFLQQLDGAATSAPSVLDVTQQSLLEQQARQYHAQHSALQSLRDSRVAEQQVNEAVIHKLQGTLPIVARRAADMKTLADKQLLAHNQYLEAEEQHITQQQDLAAAIAKRAQLAAAVRESEQQIVALVAEARANTLTRITEGERLVGGLHEQWTQAQDLDNKQVLYAPADGVVKDLAINTVGGVVLEAQQLMLIVPEDDQLEVEAWLPNKDIGFVHVGQSAQVKIHTFPFSKYGTVPATVTRVAGDAVQPATEQSAQVAAQHDLAFSMSVLLARNTLNVDGKLVTLVPGMQVTVEAITRQRRIIEFFLSPLQQRGLEGLRER